MRQHISGREATYMAIESDKRGPVQSKPLPADVAANAQSMTTGSAKRAAENTASVRGNPWKSNGGIGADANIDHRSDTAENKDSDWRGQL
jgi:hypothetical protein